MEVVPGPLLSYPRPWGLSMWGARFSLPNSWPWQLKSLKCCNHEIREDDFFYPITSSSGSLPSLQGRVENGYKGSETIGNELMEKG